MLELPNTFRDFIDVSRVLQITYVWIDSLCIDQDDEIDWNYHVDAMVDIYRNAHITIAAGASIDDDGGLFRDVPDMYIQLQRVALVSQGQTHEIHLRSSPRYPDCRGGACSPLMQRGWVFKERLLSNVFCASGLRRYNGNAWKMLHVRAPRPRVGLIMP